MKGLLFFKRLILKVTSESGALVGTHACDWAVTAPPANGPTTTRGVCLADSRASALHCGHRGTAQSALHDAIPGDSDAHLRHAARRKRLHTRRRHRHGRSGERRGPAGFTPWRLALGTPTDHASGWRRGPRGAPSPARRAGQRHSPVRKFRSRANCASYCWGSAWQGAADTVLAQPDSAWTEDEKTRGLGRGRASARRAEGGWGPGRGAQVDPPG